jgi:ornithine cyclodeaminase
MRNVDAAAVHRALDYGSLIEALRAAFRAGCELPVRHHHTVTTPDGSAATLLLMPAWRVGGRIGVKTVTVFPGNAARGLPSVMGVYLLLDGATGAPLALIDGVALTLRRTAAASALAASYLARPDAWRLVMVGAGALAPHLVRAHAAARPIREVAIWNRSPARAEALAADLAGEPFAAAATANLAEAVAGADIVSCATLSHQPLVRGEWLRPGTHLDLVGGFTPAMREADDETVRRARLFVDTRDGALKEAGDIVQPLRAGLIGERDVEADLFELCRGERPGRSGADEITLFKSVGTALEDLAAAELVYDRAAG